MSDHESMQSHEKNRKKRMRCAAYIAAFAVFQVIVILVFVMVVMKVRTPELRIGNGVTVQSLTTGNSSALNLSFIAPIRIKNNNFGPYKYDPTTIYFAYSDQGIDAGQVTIPKSKANFMSTKKLEVTVSVNSTALASNSGILTLSSQARMEGRAEIVFIFKKKKATDMNCTLEFDVSAKMIRSVECK